MYYKPNIDESVQRYKALWAREAKDRILVKIDIQDMDNPSYVKAYSFAPDFEAMEAEWIKGFESNKAIHDDNLPVIYSELGAYMIGGYFGADIKWGTGGAYSDKLIMGMENPLEYLRFDRENGYFKMQMEYLDFLKNRSPGKYGFTEQITIDGMNFLDCVRHGDAYTDVYDYPSEIITIMDFASDFNINLIKEQRANIPGYRGGRFNFYQIWTPGETLFISVDAYGQCSAEVFEKFGRKYVQRLIDEFGGGWLHVHSDAMRLLKNYVTLDGLVAIGLEDWIFPPKAIDHLDEIIEITGDIPLMVNISKEELLTKIEEKTLRGNILYWVSGVSTAEEANMIAEKSYRYRGKSCE